MCDASASVKLPAISTTEVRNPADSGDDNEEGDALLDQPGFGDGLADGIGNLSNAGQLGAVYVQQSVWLVQLSISVGDGC
jgi:hypothetical protein